MGVFERAKRIAQANLNHLLTSGEPEQELRKTILDIERVRSELRAALVALGRQKVYLTRQLREHKSEADKWQARAGLAVRTDSDELARRALERRRKSIAAHDAAVEELKQTVSNIRSTQSSLRALSHKLEAARHMKLVVTAGLPSSDRFDRDDTTLFHAVAWTELGTDPLEDEFRELEKRDLDRELEQLRQKLGKT